MTTEQTLVVLPDGRLAYTVQQAALVVPFSEQTISRALRKPADDGEFPPPLKGHRGGKCRGVVLATDLQAWLERLPPY